MEKEVNKQMVERLCREKENRMDKNIDEMIITEALGVATEQCYTQDDYFKALSALNLLNSAIKDNRWKRELTYGFIKGRASELFDTWISNPVEGVKAYYNGQERAVFFEV